MRTTRSRRAPAVVAPRPVIDTGTWRWLALIVFGALLAGAWMMNRDQSWGDDFAAYAMQARSIVRGDMPEYVEANAFTMEQSSHVFGPVTEPWGYPLLLAPMYALFGLRVQALKAVGLLCYGGLLAAFFLLARTRLRDGESLLLTTVLAFNVGMLAGTNEILSDIPFAMWSTLSLWLMLGSSVERTHSRGRLMRAALLGAALFAAVFTRVVGFVLFVPLVITQIGEVRLWPLSRDTISRVLAPYVVFAVLYALQALTFPSVAHSAPWGTITAKSVWENLVGYFWAPGYFLSQIVVGSGALWLVLLAFGLLCAASNWRRDLALIAYILATVGLFVVRQGMPEARYLYPLWPLLILFAFEGMLLGARRLPASLQGRGQALAWDAMLVLAVVSAAACLQLGWLNLRVGRYDHTERRGAFHPTTNAMFDFIRDQTPEDSVIIFFKPRAMRLRTERDSFFTTQCEDLPRGNYVVIEKSMGGYDQILPQDVKHCNPAVVLTPVYEKDQFVIYQVSPTG